MDLRDLLKLTKDEFQKYNIDSPYLEAEIIISEVLKIERHKIYTENIKVSESKYKKIKELVEKRKRRVPLPYLIKKVYFYDCEFKIEKGVFIPRPETELLVEKTINIYRQYFYPEKVKILDIGTGTGNISITLAKNIENCEVIGVDISKKSLRIAYENSILNKVEKKVKFLFSDVFENIDDKFELIVSNPPYIKEDEYEKLAEEIKKEPKKGLVAGKDGLKIIKKIIEKVSYYLKKKGFLIIEIGYNQVKEIKKFIPKELCLFEIKKDFSFCDRIMVFKKI
ncbi:MAG: peptide chain release factor N(5)-glutamine methyltransferase [Candidatus Omnitrophica bacterium]|nr:peptide chain release factor N(5)-glutamine methyltransferase [Candidatus Omnitrophota bacterium]MCM8802405.1 peptide chain release factor N(5)-glutamine methyltransferase [Candidatus Omnitrophota bacterium]